MSTTDERLDHLETAVNRLNERISGVEATLHMVQWVVAVAGVVLALATAVGGFDYIKNRSDLVKGVAAAADAVKKANKVTQETQAVQSAYAEVVQAQLVEQIEAKLEAQSLDSLRLPSQANLRKEIATLGTKLKDAAKRVDSANRTTFGFVVDASESFADQEYAEALKYLDQVKGEDRRHFVHAHMRGLCLLRLDRRDEAAREFTRAGSLAVGRRQSQALNLRGVAELSEWQTSKNRQYLEGAERAFQEVIRLDPTFPTAYFNLAATEAQFGPTRYEKVTACLLLPVEKDIRSLSEVAALIVEDLTRKTDRTLGAYVNDYLKAPTYDAAAIVRALEQVRGRVGPLGPLCSPAAG